jgi:hypothetical protein
MVEFAFNATGTRLLQVQKNSEALPNTSWEASARVPANAVDFGDAESERDGRSGRQRLRGVCGLAELGRQP